VPPSLIITRTQTSTVIAPTKVYLLTTQCDESVPSDYHQEVVESYELLTTIRKWSNPTKVYHQGLSGRNPTKDFDTDYGQLQQN
jgi:hypothetical protein